MRHGTQFVLHNRLLDWVATWTVCQSWCYLCYGVCFLWPKL